MNSHIYFDKGTPAISLIEEVLSDGSVTYDLVFRERVVSCQDKQSAENAFADIANALNLASVEKPLVL